MKTKLAVFAAIAGLLLSGCATPFRAPADLTHIKLERGDSRTVSVDKIWLERKHGVLVVTGYVSKNIKVKDTTKTHLDVVLYDANGEILRESVGYFEPRQISKRSRYPAFASYRLTLDPLPHETAAIAVRAHDGDHTNS